MTILTGKCYCGALQYEVENAPVMKGQCHCRACQHISGGGPQIFMAQPKQGFRYTKGQPKTFARPDLENPVSREFCAECGTHIVTRRPGLELVILKVGTLDDPSVFKAPRVAIYTSEMQDFHHIPDGMPAFEGFPPG